MIPKEGPIHMSRASLNRGDGKRLKGKNPEGKKLPKTSQKKAIFREDFEDIQKYYKIQ